ncbi:MAG: SDR family oxidoreductase [bacterium]|nr:SDR family oxidoreductase [bacterium]
MDFTGRKVLVTGGSRGIGKAIAEAFARQGATVAISYRTDNKAADSTMETLTGKGHAAFRADVTDPTAVQTLITETVGRLGGLDVVVNNAAIFVQHPLAEVEYDEWRQTWGNTLAANLTGPANVCYCAGRYMMQHGGGRIVNVSSRGAFRGEPDAPAYGASKGGLNAMSQSLAKHLAPYGIFVGVVAPGFVETDMTKYILDGPEGDTIRNQSPLGRVARPDEVAQAVLFLAADGSEFMTGTIIDVNGASYLRS